MLKFGAARSFSIRVDVPPQPNRIFASAVQHEVNNPLSYVMGNLEYLAKRLTELRRSLPADVADELDQTARDAMDGAQRIRHLMMALRVMSRAEDEEAPAPFALETPIESALAAVRGKLRHRAMLVCAMAPVPPVMGCEGELTRVVLSLLQNALEAIEPGQVLQNEIRVSSRVEDGFGIVDITDTGCGIRPEHRSRVFEPFFTTKGAQRGAGLGLSLARQSLRAMGGSLKVHSKWGKGTTVRLAVPLAVTTTALARVEDSLRPARVLVIDDDSLVGRAIQRVLVGHDVTSVDNGEEAVALLERDPHFDVVLCDIMMPNMSGIEVQASVRRFNPELAERFSFITGGAYTKETRQFVKKTPQTVMQKPLMTNQLRDEIERQLSGHRRIV